MELPMTRTVDLPEDIARYLDELVQAGRFESTADALRASIEALSQREASESEKAEQLRAAWDAGVRSLQENGPQLQEDADFEAFLDDCERSARQ